ncbi:MAG: hypothetical protein IKU58_05600 [Clostridia bacterium]|nr:hypothetical protein [Clostridia bacterium]
MNMQEGGPLRGPEDMLALAERLAAGTIPGRPAVLWDRLPRWAKNLLWALGGAGAVGLVWLTGGA